MYLRGISLKLCNDYDEEGECDAKPLPFQVPTGSLSVEAGL